MNTAHTYLGTKKGTIEMIRTRLMATITQEDGSSIERRVYVDEYENLNVKINGEFFRVFFLTTHGRSVSLWKSC